MIGSFALAIALRLRHPGHRDRRLRGRGAAAGGARASPAGARTAFYRAAMLVAGGVVDHARGRDLVGVRQRRSSALLYLPFMVVSWRGARSRRTLPAPPRTPARGGVGAVRGLPRAAPRRSRSWPSSCSTSSSDNLTQALTRPFLVQAGFNDFDVGVATATIGQAAAIAGTLVGGLLTDRIGLGRALWIFGFLQIVSNLGYAAVAQVGVNRPLMYAAQAFELGSSGLGQGAFGVLLLRLTQKRFSATQYALLSSLFTLPRILAGPVAGVLADSHGLARLLHPDRGLRGAGHGDARPLRAVGRAGRRVRGAGAARARAAARRGRLSRPRLGGAAWRSPRASAPSALVGGLRALHARARVRPRCPRARRRGVSVGRRRVDDHRRPGRPRRAWEGWPRPRPWPPGAGSRRRRAARRNSRARDGSTISGRGTPRADRCPIRGARQEDRGGRG